MKLLKIFSIAVVLAVITSGSVLWHKKTSEPEKTSLTDEKLKEEIGQMIMIGFRGTTATENSDIYRIIKEVKIGGVAFSDYDVSSNGSLPRNIINPEQTKKLISDLQKYSADPLFVAIDAEGGNINRLKSKYGFLPILSPEEMGQDDTLKTTAEESAKLAEELKNLGFNMNFAPVVDLDINPQNPIIGALDRSFSSNPEKVINQARVFIANHLKNNIITVKKHFPGQGSATEDSHLGISDVTDTYQEDELFPYQKLNDEELLNAVMVGHIINRKIDGVFPATLSKIFLQDILRKQIGFKGVIVSDDMQMAAISNNYGFNEAIMMAVNAGCDIIYTFNNISGGYDKDIAYKVRDIIFNAVKENKIEEKRITESYNRILDLKKIYKIIQSPEEISQRNFELVGITDALTFQEVLDIAKSVEEITGTRPAFLLAILQEEFTLEKSDFCYLTNFDTGEGVRAISGESLAKVMNPTRDIPSFLNITRELRKDPSKTLVTCPMSFGWGGAMGPADFIPSTWMRYKNKLESITGKPADPWDISDAFLAAGLYLSDSGAKLKSHDGEWNAAMLYFSLSINSPYTWYANDVLTIAENLQADINTIAQSK